MSVSATSRNGNSIRERRKALGLSQEELAEKIEVSAGLISHIETGFRPVSPRTAIKLEKILGIPKEQMVFGGSV
jgi:transcriptional regulator with XRE-family HTH domain